MPLKGWNYTRGLDPTLTCLQDSTLPIITSLVWSLFPPISLFPTHKQVLLFRQLKNTTLDLTVPSSYCYFSYPNLNSDGRSSQSLFAHLALASAYSDCSCLGTQWILCCQLQRALSYFTWFWFLATFDKVKSSLLFESFTSLGLQDLTLCLLQ